VAAGAEGTGRDVKMTSKKPKYEPNLSPELKKHLERSGTLDKFRDDYRQMCNNFKPSKAYIPGKEPKPKTYEELDEKERAELEKIGRSYAHALHTLLELGIRCHNKNLGYTLIGGFGVLGHLYKHNNNFPLKWRGTEDIDIVSQDNLDKVYKDMGLEIISPEKVDTTMIPDGKLDTWKANNPYHDRPIKIQDRRTISLPTRSVDISKTLHAKRVEVKFYGVPIYVASAEHLVQTKRGIRTRKNKLGAMKDAHDVEHLFSISKLEKIVEEDKPDQG
jgi:hypothetical protein